MVAKKRSDPSYRFGNKVAESYSYHDVHVETERIKGRLFDLPYGYFLRCCRVGGWELWHHGEREQVLVAGEYDENWLVVRCGDVVVVDSRRIHDDDD